MSALSAIGRPAEVRQVLVVAVVPVVGVVAAVVAEVVAVAVAAAVTMVAVAADSEHQPRMRQFASSMGMHSPPAKSAGGTTAIRRTLLAPTRCPSKEDTPSRLP